MFKKLVCLVAVIIALWLFPKPVFAYGPDVHFNLTYVLCRLAGLPADDSLWIADADQSMDKNECTTAYSDVPDTLRQEFHLKEKVWIRNGESWHAFTDVGADDSTLSDITQASKYSDPAAARNAVEMRLTILWDEAEKAAHTDSTHRNNVIKADYNGPKNLDSEMV